VFGIVAGSLSLISLTENVWRLGLARLPAQILDYYHSALSPARNVIEEMIRPLFPARPPEWYFDLYVLSFLLFSTIWRARARVDPEISRRFLLASPFTILPLAVIGSIPLLGLLYPPYSLFFVLRYRGDPTRHSRPAFSDPPFLKDRYDYNIALVKLFFQSLGAMLVVALMFFAWNFQAT
jgi:hypothetical protein